MSVNRYSVGYKDSASGRYAAMLDKPDGGYVSHEDYAALEQKLAESQREFRAADATIENLQMQVEKLAAENAGLKDFVKTCFRAAADGTSLDGADIQELGERLGLFGRETYQPALHGYICGHEAGEDTVYVMKKTPQTDAFLAEVRAGAIPEGYVLVPQEMHLSSEAMEGICFHCGDGGFVFGEFTDGLLFVGAIDDSDGQKIHGLHIATADYPEEGCATICEFLPAPTQGAAPHRKGVQS
ncbi:hypothetical protein ACJ5W3_002730 [Enterobacter hormaechei]|nr:hypothetical protein [Enterobacter hormaechei subsp. steigerwaltii]ELX8345488.1 hypothetical protein [Enterobacter hormaechei]ELZ2868178.1 hypothetical protein [Enterobacter hormaechei]